MVGSRVQRLTDHDAGLRRATPLHVHQPDDDAPVAGERLVDKVEAVGGGGNRPQPCSGHGECPVGVTGAPGHADRTDVPIRPDRGKWKNYSGYG